MSCSSMFGPGHEGIEPGFRYQVVLADPRVRQSPDPGEIPRTRKNT